MFKKNEKYVLTKLNEGAILRFVAEENEEKTNFDRQQKKFKKVVDKAKDI